MTRYLSGDQQKKQQTQCLSSQNSSNTVGSEKAQDSPYCLIGLTNLPDITTTNRVTRFPDKHFTTMLKHYLKSMLIILFPTILHREPYNLTIAAAPSHFYFKEIDYNFKFITRHVSIVQRLYSVVK